MDDPDELSGNIFDVFCQPIVGINGIESGVTSLAIDTPAIDIDHDHLTMDSELTSRSATKPMTMYYQNVRGLRMKTKQFKLSSTSSQFDVIAVTESGLHPGIYDGELFNCNNFSVYRCDRSALNSDHERFGGVLVAVRSHIASERVVVPLTESVELVLVRLSFGKASVYVCCLYIPSGSAVSVYQEYEVALRRVIEFVDMNIEDKFFVLGDFNMTKVSWLREVDDDDGFSVGNFLNPSSSALLPCNVGSGTVADMLYCLLGADLSQINGVKNCNERMLDLVFASDPDDASVRLSSSPFVVVDGHHPPLEIEFSVGFDDVVTNESDDHEYNFKKADFVGMNAYLESVNWDIQLRDMTDVDVMVDRFYELLSVGLERYVPIRKKLSNSHPPWYSKRLLNLKNRRNRAHKKYKSKGDTPSYVKFCSLRNEFDASQARAYQSYLDRVQDGLVTNPTAFWRYVNTMKRTTGYPSLMHRGDRRTTTPKGKCDLFAEFFRDVFIDERAPSDKTFGLGKCVDVGSLSISENQLISALNYVDTAKGDGPDNVSPLLLKNCSSTLCAPLLRIFNLSLMSNFPSRWKESYVVPIFKSGSRSDVECYRGVAILPTFGKLFESIVCDMLTEKFRKVVSVAQHGFMKGRSTSTNLVDFVNEVIRSVERGRQVDVVYTDMRKAFDRVHHGLLLRKLEELGVHSSMLQWLRTYLVGRTQHVRMLGCKSEPFSVTSGVPQGSHLGPLLFLIFFNDVTRVIRHSKCSLYADDLKVYREVKSLEDSLRLQHDLAAISRWCVENFLNLNVQKCVTISFFRIRSPVRFSYVIDGSVVKRVNEVRDLGVVFTENVSFNRHIEVVIAKAYSMLGFVKRVCRDFRNVEALKSLYFAYVRSHLEYASLVWSPYYQSHIDSIESIQKDFLIYALRRTVRRGQDYRLPSYVSRCESIGLESLSRRRFNLAALFVYDILTGRVDSPELLDKFKVNVPTRNFRNSRYLVLARHRSNYGLFEPVNNLSRIFNLFSHHQAVSATRGAFRSLVRSTVLTDANLKRHGFLVSAG